MQLIINFGVILASFFCNPEVLAIDSVGVGFREGVPRWNQGVSESRFVAITSDSIWTWNVRPDQNLAVGTLSRFGSVFVPGQDGGVATFLSGAEVMFDGSDSTAFDPDQFNERFGVDRRSAIYIDLGEFGGGKVKDRPVFSTCCFLHCVLRPPSGQQEFPNTTLT